MRVEVALRSPLGFRLPGPLLTSLRDANLDSVAVTFEGRDFVWHPPLDYEDEEFGLTKYGPMVSVVIGTNDDNDGSVSSSLQRFLSAMAFGYKAHVEDVGFGATGGSGERDAFNPHGARAPRVFAATSVHTAPARINAHDDPVLWLTLAYYREGVNASSPFYRCVAFRNALDAAFAVANEDTPEANARDALIDATAALYAEWARVVKPAKQSWSRYFREEIRNAVAHVWRASGRRRINPDHPHDRIQLRRDSAVLQEIVGDAVEQRWPNGFRVVGREE